MTTKAQELKALEQIKKIVEELGEDSYIGTAFEGCFEIAQQNIENDFACSMKQEVESLEKQLREERIKTESAKKQLDVANTDRSCIIADYSNLKKTSEAMLQECGRIQEATKKTSEEWKAKYEEATKVAEEKQQKIEALELETIKLKAKLYDLLTK